jgi:hypothetical protein
VIGGGFLAFAVLSILVGNGLFKGRLWDLVFLGVYPFLFFRVLRRPNLLWVGLGGLIAVAWVLDLWVYLRVIPAKVGIWTPFIEWASGFKNAEDMQLGWLVRTIAGLGLFAAFAGAVKAKKELMSFSLVLSALAMIGFQPVITERMAVSRTVSEVPLNSEREEDVRAITAGRTYQDVVVLAEKDNNGGSPPIRVRKGQIVVVEFVSEPASFLFTDMRFGPTAKKNPALIAGTFQAPCVWDYSYFKRVNRKSVPCEKMPTSTTVVRVGGGAYHPLTKDITVLKAAHTGEVNFAYNFPRGLSSHTNGNSLGKRIFRVWVLNSSDLSEVAQK